jgi:myo-inositol-1(or 4)-monophosphatase
LRGNSTAPTSSAEPRRAAALSPKPIWRWTFLKEKLLAARPGYGWLSEESRDNSARLTAARVFVVDLIDGTVAFVKHRPHFTICAAVVEAGRPQDAVVYNPIAEECFTARAGGGAFLNGMPIHVGDRDGIGGARMLGPKTTFQQCWPAMEITSYSSIAYRIALVLTDEAGQKLIYNRAAATQRAAVAAGPKLHALLLDHLRQ